MIDYKGNSKSHWYDEYDYRHEGFTWFCFAIATDQSETLSVRSFNIKPSFSQERLFFWIAYPSVFTDLCCGSAQAHYLIFDFRIFFRCPFLLLSKGRTSSGWRGYLSSAWSPLFFEWLFCEVNPLFGDHSGNFNPNSRSWVLEIIAPWHWWSKLLSFPWGFSIVKISWSMFYLGWDWNLNIDWGITQGYRRQWRLPPLKSRLFSCQFCNGISLNRQS